MKNVPELYEHQKRAFDFIKDKDIFALFMEMGTGKSKLIVEKTHYLWKNSLIDCVIIISPNSVKSQWVQEQFEIHYPENGWYGIVWNGFNTKKDKETFHNFCKNKLNLFVFSANVEAFQSNSIDLYIKILLENRRLFVVIDESTRIKNGRRKPVRGKRGGAKRTNKILDLFECTKYKAILTGTPTPNNPFDLWSQFEFLKKDYFKRDYFFFTHHYGIMIKHSTNDGKRYNTVLDKKLFQIIKSKINNFEELTPAIIEDLSASFGINTKDVIRISEMKEYSGYKNLTELRERIKPVTFFVKKENCLDLPDKIYEKLHCFLEQDQKRIYEQLKKQMYSEYGGKELTVTTKIVMFLRLQMVTGGLFPHAETTIKLDKEGEEYFDTHFEYSYIKNNVKVKTLLEDLAEVPEESSIIIWARFRGEIDLIEEQLTIHNYSCEKYYGGSNISVIDRFKNKCFRILIANPLKGGEGLNLQVATLHYFYSNSFKADSRLQAEDRSHRIGQSNKVLYKDIICKNTVDEIVYDTLKIKEDLINYFRTSGDKFLD